MTPSQKLSEIIRPGPYQFNPGKGGSVQDLFCSRCGGFKPQCNCNRFESQLKNWLKK